MALKAVVENLDSVPEALREHYTAGEGGRFYLAADDVDSLPAVSGLKRKRDELLEAQRKLKEDLSKFDGIDPEEARTAAERARKGEQDKLGKEEAIEATRRTMQAAFETEREKFTGEIAERDSFIRSLLVDNTLSAELDRANVLPEYREAVKALFEKQAPQVVREDGKYRAVFKTDVGDVPISQHVEKWAKSEAAAPFIAASGTSGSGAQGSGRSGSGDGNPWSKDSFNLTKQGELMKSDPAKARRMAAAAGVVLQ